MKHCQSITSPCHTQPFQTHSVPCRVLQERAEHLARGWCLWVDSSCYWIWESLIAAAIEFDNEFPQSAFDSSCYPIWQWVPTVYFWLISHTNQEVCSHAHLALTFVLPTVPICLQSYFCKFSLWIYIECKLYHANKSILCLLTIQML